MKKIFIYLLLSVVMNIQFGICKDHFYKSLINEKIEPDITNTYNKQKFFTDSNGNILMYVNIWGHVKSPGRHIVYDGIDIPTLLSIVGGPESGANLKKIKLYRAIPDENGNIMYHLNLMEFYNDGVRDSFINIKPNDTIIIPQTKTSYIMSYSSTINTVLQVINLFFQINSK